ncbi:MAG: amidohydrolase family protein, partial [Synergistales bacterium]|nr:amidohydrolase family protein [Synergistales bacterium]
MKKRRLFRGATLIDGTGAEPLKNSFLLVEGGRIEASGMEGRDELPDFDELVDLSGKYLIPGLMNCHTHVVMDPVPDMQAFAREQTPVTFAVRGVRNLQTLLRSGTTFIRDMGAPYAVDLGLKKCMGEGLFQGPEMYCSARMIT